MAKTASKKKTTKSPPARRGAGVRKLIRRLSVGAVVVCVLILALYRFVPVWTTPYMWSERRVLGEIEYEWTKIDDMSEHVLLSAVAAEDANFCLHWGFDMRAIRSAIQDGGQRGASTITQQVVKNLFLWQGRSWPRKALEAILTPTVELIWSKRRILELYVNVAEYDTGVFGAEAASNRYFGIGSDAVSPEEAALLAAVLPNPKKRSASDPSAFMVKRAANIVDGAATIRKDGRSDCFLD